jgi:hypothetical protein
MRERKMKELVIPIRVEADRESCANAAEKMKRVGDLAMTLQLMTEQAEIVIPVMLDGKQLSPIRIPIGHVVAPQLSPASAKFSRDVVAGIQKRAE